MKKIIVLMCCLLAALMFVSCDTANLDNGKENDGANNDNITSQPSEAEIAMEMYQAAINDEIYVFDERLGKVKLKSLRFTSNDTSLDECKLLKKAILDVDQDGVNEYVIQSPDNKHIILRYYNGKVYSYRFDISDFYNFNTDGTFYWYDPSAAGGKECGLNKIIFDGETLNTKPIYSLKYSANPTKYEYFVEGEAATESEYHTCRAHITSKKEMRFSPFELACSYPITAEQAWDLANAYWDHQDGRTDGGAGTIWTARIALIDTPNAETDNYRFAFQVEWNSGGGLEGYECMPPYNIQLMDQILVNAFTGEITASTYDPDIKGVSVEEAIEIAKNHRTYMSGETCNEENGYRVVHTPDATAPDHIYVIVIQKNDTQTDRIWIDKNTGEIIFPYYMYGK